jgi:hypothetical protein
MPGSVPGQNPQASGDLDDNTGEDRGDKRHNVITTRDDSDDVTMQWHGDMTTIAT